MRRAVRILKMIGVDACKTYELTWAIRLATERNRKLKKEAEATPAAA